MRPVIEAASGKFGAISAIAACAELSMMPGDHAKEIAQAKIAMVGYPAGTIAGHDKPSPDVGMWWWRVGPDGTLTELDDKEALRELGIKGKD